MSYKFYYSSNSDKFVLLDSKSKNWNKLFYALKQILKNHYFCQREIFEFMIKIKMKRIFVSNILIDITKIFLCEYKS